jgi:hypothetical protein
MPNIPDFRQPFTRPARGVPPKNHSGTEKKKGLFTGVCQLRPLGSLVFQLFTSDIRFHCRWFAAASLEQQLQRSFSLSPPRPIPLLFLLLLLLPPPPPPCIPHIHPCHLFNPAETSIKIHAALVPSYVCGRKLKNKPYSALTAAHLHTLISFAPSSHSTPSFTFPCTILSLKSTRTLILKPCPPSSLKRATLD